MHTPTTLLNRLLSRGKFRHLQVLLQLAELGSVQRTAQAIGMTQSSVTQTLAYVEQLLEVRLFDRHARGVRPTLACTDLLPVARQLMLGLADGAAVLAARRNRGEGYVRVIASASALHGLLLDALPPFSQQHPGIQVHLWEAEGDDQLLAIARQEVDLAVCREPAVPPQGWSFEALRPDSFVVVCRAQHPLAGVRTPSWKVLGAHRWLVLPTGLAARQRFDEMAQRFAAAPELHPLVTRAAPMLWRLLLQEDLLALLPHNLARPMLVAGTLVSLCAGPPPALAPLGLLSPVVQPSAAALRLQAFLQQQARTGA